MFKAFRLVKEASIDKPTGQDAEDKKRLKDLDDSVVSLEQALPKYCKAFADFNAAASGIHLHMANMYPSGKALSVAVMSLNSNSAAFMDAPRMVSSTWPWS